MLLYIKYLLETHGKVGVLYLGPTITKGPCISVALILLGVNYGMLCHYAILNSQMYLALSLDLICWRTLLIFYDSYGII